MAEQRKSWSSLANKLLGSNKSSNKTPSPNAADRAAALASRTPVPEKPEPENPAPETPIPLDVIGVDHNFDGVVLITLQTQDGNALPGYEPGCHADVHIPTEQIENTSSEDLVRQYSLFPTETIGQDGPEEGKYGIAVKLEPDSRGGSIALHKVKVGDTLRINPPRNKFALDPSAKRTVLVGAGVGIAPIYSLARQLKLQGADYTILYFASSTERAVMQHLIDAHLQGQTRSIFATGAREKQAGFITEALTSSNVAPEDTHLYVCGPQGFMDGVIEVAGTHIPKGNIHWEAFRPTEETLAGNIDADGPFEVEFMGETYAIGEGVSVLDVFEEEDLPIMSRCFEGTCGTCVMKVVAGTPDHRDSFFTEEQHEQGAFATCVSRALSPKLSLERWKNI